MAETIWRRVDIFGDPETFRTEVEIDAYRLEQSYDAWGHPALKPTHSYTLGLGFLKAYRYYRDHGYVREHYAGPSTSKSGMYELRLTKRTNTGENR